MPARIAVDAMGGDRAPEVVVEAALGLPESDIEVVLVGPEAQLTALVSDRSAAVPVSIVDAAEVIDMAESPSAVVKGKPRSSIHVGIGLVVDGRAEAFVSAGNTGAIMAVAMVMLGRLPGVARPALPSVFPTVDGHCLVLDVGANMDCRAEHLMQFAQMGHVYTQRVLGFENPRVGLLNVGEEPGKGNEAVRAAHTLMASSDRFEFVGNVEGRDVMMGVADVVVCDGFVGNVLLKFGESVKTILPALVRAQVAELGGGDGQAAVLLQQVLAGVSRRFSYEEFGGTPLLGVDGTVFIGHGGSSARALARMIEAAAETVRADIRGTLRAAFTTS